jgi:hypothetical protein
MSVWGECTWFVNQVFNLPTAFSGNADTYVQAAEDTPGYKVSSTPAEGTIMALPANQGGAGGDGHVAVVTKATQSAAGVWSITVAEMNWTNGIGAMDFRNITLPTSGSPYQFIYTPSSVINQSLLFDLENSIALKPTKSGGPLTTAISGPGITTPGNTLADPGTGAVAQYNNPVQADTNTATNSVTGLIGWIWSSITSGLVRVALFVVGLVIIIIAVWVLLRPAASKVSAEGANLRGAGEVLAA